MVLRNAKQWIGLVILLIWPIFISQAFAEGNCKLHKKENKAIANLFGENHQVVPVNTSMEGASFSEYLHPGDCIYRITHHGEMQGYLISTSAKGRYDYFDYSVIFSKDFTILKVIVTVYRSTQGAAICQKNWLSQFEGYSGGNLELGSDIDAVSGGTLSAISMVKDIRRCHLLITSFDAK
jgi:hypothetical protein